MRQVEAGVKKPRRATLDVTIRRAFEQAGVEFLDENGGGAGVRFRGSIPQISLYSAPV